MGDAEVTQTGVYNAHGNRVLKRSFVAYLDELGTSERLNAYSQTDLEHDLQKYDDLLQFLNGDPDEDARSAAAGSYVINTFSDNISVCSPADDAAAECEDTALSEAFIFLQGIALYQGNMILRQTLLRGGIALGDVYARVGFVTGRAHVRAVTIEEKEAIFPRIVLDDPLVEYLEDLMKSSAHARDLFRCLLRADPRGDRRFLDYLRFLADEEGTETAAEELLLNHREIIRTGLSRYPEDSAGHVRAKYLWLADYHNVVCDEFQKGALKVLAPFPGEVRFAS